MGYLKQFSSPERGSNNLARQLSCQEQERWCHFCGTTVQKTILVVDDSPDVLKFVSAALIDGGFIICLRVAARMPFGRFRIVRAKYIFIVSDFEMPEMNEMELAAALTADPPALPVLLMSGSTGGMLVLNEGWHFLPKPFVASKLLAMVVTLISPERASRFLEYPLPAAPK